MRLFKRCPDCGVEKAISDFNRNSARPDGLQFYCRDCFSRRSARNYRERRLRRGLAVRDRVAAPAGHKYCPRCRQVRPHQQWHRNKSARDGFASYCKPCRNEMQRHEHLMRTFGLTEKQLDALIESQGGVCAICRDGKPEHVDHDHDTGFVRGVLCGPCNMGLGLFKDDTLRLTSAVDYLHRARFAALGVTVEEYDLADFGVELDSRRFHAA